MSAARPRGGVGAAGGAGSRDPPEDPPSTTCAACEANLPSGPPCSLALCEACCLLAQQNNGMTCSLHEPSDSSSSAGSGSSTSSKRMRENITRAQAIAIMKEHFKDAVWLNITSPQLMFCPRSLALMELKNEQAGCNLVQRKVDTWMATHSKFQDNASEVTSLARQVMLIIGREGFVQDPLDAVNLLKEPLRRMYALMIVRGKAGYVGMKTFLERSNEAEEVPDIYADVLPAALAAGRRAYAARREADEAHNDASGAAGNAGASATLRGRGGGGRFRGRRPGLGGRGGQVNATQATTPAAAPPPAAPNGTTPGATVNG